MKSTNIDLKRIMMIQQLNEKWRSICFSTLMYSMKTYHHLVYCLKYITRKCRVMIIHIGWWTENPNPHFISLLQLCYTHFATWQPCLRWTVITMIPWLKFTINDEWSMSNFSSLGQNGPVKNVHSRSRCYEYSRGWIIPLFFVEIHICEDDPFFRCKIIDMILQLYVKGNFF